jgi:hypothetical protein
MFRPPLLPAPPMLAPRFGCWQAYHLAQPPRPAPPAFHKKKIAGDAAPLGCHPPMDKGHHRASLKSQRENTAATFDRIVLCAELYERDGPPILIETGVIGRIMISDLQDSP